LLAVTVTGFDPQRTFRQNVDSVSPELIEQRLGLLQDRRVQPFGEPAVDRRKQVAGFGALALIAPQADEAGGGAQLEELCALPPPTTSA
jgi:hypothetical protein